ncbi:hypothetical protein BDF22DRAFT_669993 [Syncephalis plumigaleata]|nr:hypothetical protein BDF22DRAFT_669993 [Syncephalis plumigaleata]
MFLRAHLCVTLVVVASSLLLVKAEQNGASTTTTVLTNYKQPSHFLYQPLHKPGAFGLNELVITSGPINNNDGRLPIVAGIYKGKEVRVTCAREGTTGFPEFNVYRRIAEVNDVQTDNDNDEIDKRDGEIDNDGEIYVRRPLLHFSSKVPADMSEEATYISLEAVVLFNLLKQTLRGAAYLNRYHISYNTYTPGSICVTTNANGQPQIQLYDYKEAELLRFARGNVFLNMPHKSYAIDSPEWRMQSYVDPRKNELWSIASLYYALLFDVPDKKGKNLASKYRDSLMDIRLQMKVYRNTPSAFLRRILKKMFVPVAKDRKTPEEFWKHLKSLESKWSNMNLGVN